MSFSTSPTQPPNPMVSAIGRGLYRLMGWACIASFVIDTAVLVLLPSPNAITNALPSALQWRLGVISHLGDRSILLLLGLGLLMIGVLDRPRMRRTLAQLCWVIGIVSMALMILCLVDSTALHHEIQAQLAMPLPDLKVKLDPIVMQQTATRQIIKSSTLSLGNLIIVTLGMIGIGRYGLHRH
jgi:hypothetical protein